MAAVPLEIEQAIADVLEQVRAELIRLYLDDDVGRVEVHRGKTQLVVKATPERINKPIRLSCN